MLSASARVFLIRHGETDWTVGGKHSGTTDVPLSKAGERDAESLKELVVGDGKLIDPTTVARMYVMFPTILPTLTMNPDIHPLHLQC